MKISRETRGVWVTEGDNAVYIPAEDSSSDAAEFLKRICLALEIGAAALALVERQKVNSD